MSSYSNGPAAEYKAHSKQIAVDSIQVTSRRSKKRRRQICRSQPSGRLPGVKGTKGATAMWRAAFPDAKIIVEDTIAEADKVVIQGSGQATLKGPFLDVPPTVKRVTLEGITIFRVEESRVAEQCGELDLLGIMRQLGVFSLGQYLQE